MSVPSDVPEGTCSRGDWCTGRTITVENGQRIITPAATPRPFCEACAGFVGECLAELPPAYRRLARALGQRPVTGNAVRVPFGPRLPLRENVDALMRQMAAALCSWEARTRAAASWNPRDPSLGVHTPEAITEAVRVLRENMSVLMALQPSQMIHVVPMQPGKAGTRGQPFGEIAADIEELYGEHEMVRRGEDFLTVLIRLGAQDAGHVILRLRARCLAQLGENKPQAEMFDGIPCRQCGDMGTLERAEPPSDPAKPAMHSRCVSCDHKMPLKDFQRWAAWYGGWADSEGLTCRRCLNGDHHECAYGLCACHVAVDHSRRRNQAALIAA